MAQVGGMSKYRNKKITVDGMTFDSKGEYHRWCELQLLERAGVIENLRFKPPKWNFQIGDEFLTVARKGSKKGTKVSWTADFDYQEKSTDESGRETWSYVVEDFKGMNTRISKLKHGLMRLFHNIDVRITRKASY